MIQIDVVEVAATHAADKVTRDAPQRRLVQGRKLDARARGEQPLRASQRLGPTCDEDERCGLEPGLDHRRDLGMRIVEMVEPERDAIALEILVHHAHQLGQPFVRDEAAEFIERGDTPPPLDMLALQTSTVEEEIDQQVRDQATRRATLGAVEDRNPVAAGVPLCIERLQNGGLAEPSGATQQHRAPRPNMLA